ncbi:MAG: hypothetical protein ACRESR_07505 [Gammaproteobacteria bacterium]
MKTATYGKTLVVAAALGAAGVLSGCVVRPAVPPTPRYAITAAPTSAPCNSCGTITSIQAESPTGYVVTIRMDDGTVRTVRQTKQPAFQVGDRVQLLVRTSS